MQRPFLVEVEVFEQVSEESLLLRYLSFSRFTPTLYPRIYAAIMA